MYFELLNMVSEQITIEPKYQIVETKENSKYQTPTKRKERLAFYNNNNIKSMINLTIQNRLDLNSQHSQTISLVVDVITQHSASVED